LFVFALILLLAYPVLLGGIFHWTYLGFSLLFIVTAGLFLAFRVRRISTANANAARALWLPGLLFSAAVAWGVIQTIPDIVMLPMAPVWAEASAALGETVAGPVSLHPFATERAAIRLLGVGAVFLLFFVAAFDAARARRSLLVISAGISVLSAYAVMAYFVLPDFVLWYPREFYFGDATGTFVNRNNFAAFAGIGFILTSVMVYRAGRMTVAGGQGARDLAAGILDLVAFPSGLWVLAWGVNLTALALSHSRAGLLAAVAGALVALALMAQQNNGDETKVRGRRVLALLVFCMLALMVFSVSGGGVLDRFGQSGDSLQLRLGAYRVTVDAMAERPWVGTGLDTYGDVFRSMRTDEFPERFARAHNTYLELLLELGLVAGAALILAPVLVTVFCFRGIAALRRRRYMVAGATGCAVQMGLHSLVDFPLQIPAIATMFAALLGLACAQACTPTLPRGTQP
jgi:O-antigen ligase